MARRSEHFSYSALHLHSCGEELRTAPLRLVERERRRLARGPRAESPPFARRRPRRLGERGAAAGQQRARVVARARWRRRLRERRVASRAFADGVLADARPEVVAASCVPSFLKKEWAGRAGRRRLARRRPPRLPRPERRDGDVASRTTTGTRGKARPPAGAARLELVPETDAPSPAVVGAADAPSPTLSRAADTCGASPRRAALPAARAARDGAADARAKTDQRGSTAADDAQSDGGCAPPAIPPRRPRRRLRRVQRPRRRRRGRRGERRQRRRRDEPGRPPPRAPARRRRRATAACRRRRLRRPLRVGVARAASAAATGVPAAIVTVYDS